MCNIVLNDDLSIRSYFEKVLELVESGEDFPVNLDDVWPLIYSDKGKAVRVLTGDNGFIKNIDYKVFTQNGKTRLVSVLSYVVRPVLPYNSVSLHPALLEALDTFLT